MKKKLIIISDLWGKGKAEWLTSYIAVLENHFDITYYDSCEIGGIDVADYTEENLHQQFIKGGIDRAVHRLTELEKESVSILAFSVGGTIAWKFGIISGNMDQLVCVSATRLRHEITKPTGEITLYYGEKDTFKPNREWFDSMKLERTVFDQKGHNCYKESIVAEKLCKRLIKT